MASPKHYASVCEELSEVQVLDSIEPLVTASSSMASSSSARVMDSIEPLVPTVSSSASVEPVAGPSGLGDSPPAIASSSEPEDDEEEAAAEPRPAGSAGRRVKPYTPDQLKSMWNWRKVFQKLGTHDQCVQFSEGRGLIPTQKLCGYHKKPMSLSKESGQVGKFRCRKSNCRAKDVSRALGTWFEDARLPLTLIFQIMYAFSEGLSYQQTINELASDDGPVVLSRTIADWFRHCWETLAKYELENQGALGKIGDPNRGFCEDSWRRRIRINHLDPFEELINAIKYVYKIE